MMTLEELSAREEIRQVIYRHFRAGDRIDAELDRTACWDDAVFIGGPVDLPMGEAIPLIYEEMMRKYFRVTNHYMMNMSMEVNGGEASGEVYAIAYHILPTEREPLEAVLGAAKLAALGDMADRPLELWIGIRYATTLSRRGDEWRIAAMRLIVDWSKVEPYTGIETGGFLSYLTLRGARDRTDPSYG